MDSERQLRSQFVRALDEALPGAPWLESAVAERLRGRRPSAVGALWIPGQRGIRLVAGVVIVAIAVAALGMAISRGWLLGSHISPAPAHTTLSIAAYQGETARDWKAFDAANNFNCTSFSDTACLPAVARADIVTRQWLADLESYAPPGKFAALDELLRRHLTRVLADDAAFVAAFRAQDASGTGAASKLFVAELQAIDVIAEAVVFAFQAPVATYQSIVATDETSLHACVLCQSSTQPVTCRLDQTTGCADKVAEVRQLVERFQLDLVKHYAPDSFANLDARLQADLVTVDRQLAAMESALSSGDQAALDISLTALEQAIAHVEDDAVAISGS